MENERTIAREALLEGKALQTGKRCRMILKPAPAASGIVFRRTDLEGVPEIKLEEAVVSGEYKRRSTIALGRVQIQTVEHFLAALWGLGIDNIIVELNGPELPAMGGSAVEFLDSLKEAGLEEQSENRRYIRIDEKIEVTDGERKIEIDPSESFSVSYDIDYKNVPCIKQEVFELELTADSFREEIAPARTFCTKKEALLLFLAGIGRGANFKNTLVLGNKGPVGTSFRFPNEPVRHKVLDLIGDLYMLGKPIVGRVVAKRSGHALNAEMVRKIHEKYLKKQSKGREK
ncbi:UDP-3-O-acyl-N-acetylglucosamine deacetylase [Candidatus Omnitrophota bacterium]